MTGIGAPVSTIPALLAWQQKAWMSMPQGGSALPPFLYLGGQRDSRGLWETGASMAPEVGVQILKVALETHSREIARRRTNIFWRVTVSFVPLKLI